jgi:hypothetical protein
MATTDSGRLQGGYTYDSFTGMGDDPASLTDQDGGLSIPYLGLTTAVGAAIGYEAESKNRWAGAALGAGIGLDVGIVSNWILIYYSTYATPDNYPINTRSAYAAGFEKYEVTYANGFIQEHWYYRGFDAWVSDKLADLFSDSYHFLGYVTNPKYEWIPADVISSEEVQKFTQYSGYDLFNEYYYTHYSPYIERIYHWDPSDRPQKIEFILNNPVGRSVDISNHGQTIETLNKANRQSKPYRVGSKTFDVRLTSGYKDLFFEKPFFSEGLEEVIVTAETRVTVKIRVRNNRLK